MSFSKIIFSPLSALYGLGVNWRNAMYEKKQLKSFHFDDIVVLSLGNLSSGGTGKTPHVAYLAKLLSQKYPLGVLSRGYGRRTKGYVFADEHATADTIGDEAMQLSYSFGEQIAIAVCEERVWGIPSMLADDPDLRLILLDDAYQHRTIEPDLSILLTEYALPYTRDHLLPLGNLREPATESRRANIIIVTKCPLDISEGEKQALIAELQPMAHQRVLFSHLRYLPPYKMGNPKETIQLDRKTGVALCAAIARPQYLLNHVQSQTDECKSLFFADHYRFGPTSLRRLSDMFKALTSEQKIVLTTEKDAPRWQLLGDRLQKTGLPFYCLPVEVYMSAEDESFLVNKIEELCLGISFE